jgi:ABC-type nitrate/sulfonate/bicarbonate transport system substrate-binding protein
VEVVEFPSGKRALNNGLFKGSVDIATSSDVPIAVSMLKGKEFKIAAVTFNAENINRVIARKDAGINKPADLVGKRIATQRASAVHFFLHLFMNEHGISQKDVEMVYMKAEKLPTALANGDIDAFSMREPYITEAKELLGDNHVVFSEPGLYSQIDAVIVDKELVQNSPKVVNSFIRALIEAEEFTITNKQKAISIISKKLGVSYDSILKLWPEVKLRITLMQSTIMLMEDIARWAIKENLIEEKAVPNSLEYIYFDSMETIKPESITVIR